jgi:hypothetical protein
MKRPVTYLTAAGVLALAAFFPIAASAGHGHDGHGDRGGRGWEGQGWGGDGRRWAHGGGHGQVGAVMVGIRVTEHMLAQVMAITPIPTNALPQGTAGIHAPIMTMAINRG